MAACRWNPNFSRCPSVVDKINDYQSSYIGNQLQYFIWILIAISKASGRQYLKKATLSRLIKEIKSPAAQQWPSGSAKLAARQDLYRVRQGNYRVIYSVDDKVRVVEVVKDGQRGDVNR